MDILRVLALAVATLAMGVVDRSPLGFFLCSVVSMTAKLDPLVSSLLGSSMLNSSQEFFFSEAPGETLIAGAAIWPELASLPASWLGLLAAPNVAVLGQPNTDELSEPAISDLCLFSVSKTQPQSCYG